MYNELGLSGVQPWSAGESFPYVVFKREVYHTSEYMAPEERLISSHWVVSFAGVELATEESCSKAEDMALLFKRRNVRDANDAKWAQALDAWEREEAWQDADHFRGSIERMQWRDEQDNRVMYGTPVHDGAPLSEVQRTKSNFECSTALRVFRR